MDFDGARALVASRAVRDGQELDEALLRRYCEPVMVVVDRLWEWFGGCYYYPLATVSATRSPTWLVV